MIRSLKNVNFYGKLMNLKVGSRIIKNFPENQTNLTQISINIATFSTFTILNVNFYKKMSTFFTKKTSDFPRREQRILPLKVDV